MLKKIVQIFSDYYDIEKIENDSLNGFQTFIKKKENCEKLIKANLSFDTIEYRYEGISINIHHSEPSPFFCSILTICNIVGVPKLVYVMEYDIDGKIIGEYIEDFMKTLD